VARVNGEPKYQSYGDDYVLKKPVDVLLKSSDVDLTNGGGFEELRQFQVHLSDSKIIVFDGLNPDRIIFIENSRSAK